MKTLTYILISISVIFWGVSFILTKELFLTEPNMSVTLLIFLRLMVASVVMVPLMAFTGKMPKLRRAPSGRQKLLRGDLKWFLLLTLCEPFIYHLCETTGVQMVSGSLASVIIATIPLFVPFGMWIAYRERISIAMILGVILSLAGVTLILVGGEGFSGNIGGILFLTGAVAIAVVYTILLVKIVDHYNPLAITTLQNLIGLIYFLPLVLLFDGNNLLQLSWSPKMIGLLLTLGIGCSTLAYAFYNLGVRRLGASQACIFNNAIPVFSLIAAVLIGQEVFSWSKAIGIAVVIVGVIIAQGRGKMKMES